jgi:hypothetical protein
MPPEEHGARVNNRTYISNGGVSASFSHLPNLTVLGRLRKNYLTVKVIEQLPLALLATFDRKGYRYAPKN